MILWEGKVQLGIQRQKCNDVKFITVKGDFFVYSKWTMVDDGWHWCLWHISKCDSVALVHNVSIYNTAIYILSALTCDAKHNMPI